MKDRDGLLIMAAVLIQVAKNNDPAEMDLAAKGVCFLSRSLIDKYIVRAVDDLPGMQLQATDEKGQTSLFGIPIRYTEELLKDNTILEVPSEPEKSGN